MLTNRQDTPSNVTILRAMADFGIELDAAQVLKIQDYIGMLLAWNEKISLTSLRDPLEILHRHFCESMFAAVAVPLEAGRLADVGSGGGFPGLPLKIIRPQLQVVLIESNIKKATFLAEVIRALDLDDTRVLVSRYEELAEEVAPLDFVCSRAVGEYGNLLAWASSQRVGANSVVLWVGGNDVEAAVTVDGWEWRDPIPVPQSLRRYLLVGTRKPGQATR